jgi:hypothetical protein
MSAFVCACVQGALVALASVPEAEAADKRAGTGSAAEVRMVQRIKRQALIAADAQCLGICMLVLAGRGAAADRLHPVVCICPTPQPPLQHATSLARPCQV